MRGLQFPRKLSGAAHTIRYQEVVIHGEWKWKKSPAQLHWWSPTIGAIKQEKKLSSVWVKFVGLALYLWSQKTFRAIGDHSGGWVEMEETQLQNHLKWERVRIKETVVKFRRISDNREWWIFLHDPSMGGAAQQLTPSEQKTEVPLQTRRYRERYLQCFKSILRLANNC
ncbi:hypothetical protein H5410_017084 [Solanum commersonii]|uniref:Uncharacterized protein n=1 Tax=Solanum commersonii TaxID=4109 RepID=A0A9J5ZZA1_SOLCO|nr:hypothetical protein H5410_017084 [Solanum commersonii]